MFASFQDAFGVNRDRVEEFPPAVIEEFNRSLPQGVRYYDFGDGAIGLGPDEEKEFTLGGLTAELTDEMMKVLGRNPNPADVFNYSYNAQKPIRLKLADPKHIIVNGKKIPINRFTMSPQHEIRLGEGSFVAHPNPFPPPFDIELRTSDGSNKLTLHVSRVPNESVNVSRFESDAEAPLVIGYSVIEPKEAHGKISMSFNFSVKPHRCSSLREVVNVLSVFKAISAGTCMIAGHPLGQPDVKNMQDCIDDSILHWLEKALAIESKLDLRFNPRKIVVGNDAILAIAELYEGLVKGRPIKFSLKNARLKLDDTATTEIENVLADKDNQFALTFSQPCDFELFEERIELQSICGIFDLSCSGIEVAESGEKELLLENRPDDPEGYLSRILFEDEDDMKAYYADNSVEEIMKQLQHAISPETA